jgi:hypothetical protein
MYREIHVYECQVMYLHCTYKFMIVNMCMYIIVVQIPIRSEVSFHSSPQFCFTVVQSFANEDSFAQSNFRHHQSSVNRGVLNLEEFRTHTKFV